MANDEQVSFWNGIGGVRWVAAQQQMDRTIGPAGRAALDAADLRPGHRVLDVGCGCGDTTIEIARRVGPAGDVLGIDISEPMLTRARERAGGAARFAHADASSADLPQVDRIFSRFGVMFFDAPEAAFTHLRAALAPDGRLTFVCWRSLPENLWAKIPFEAANAVLGPPPAPAVADPPGPFAFARPERVRALLAAAGFSDVQLTPVDLDLRWTESGTDDALRETFVRIGPAARRLQEAPDDLREPALEAILAAIRPHASADGLVLRAAVWVVSAR